jgi:peptide/nickel transport system substrate-binding protein
MGVVDMNHAGRLILCAAVAAALVGCTSNPSATTSAGAAPPFVPGTLRVADIEEPDTLNPYISTVITSIDLSYLWASYFFNVDDKDRFVPEVALEVPTLKNGGISADGLTITYHLRRGIKWQDGVPLTAKDVIFTWHAIMNDKSSVQVRTGYDKIADITAPDEYTVIVHMKEKFAPMIAYFMGLQGGGPILPAHVLERYADMNRVPFNSKPVGSGPFKVVDWVHGDHITLEANPSYWRGVPKLHQIIYKWITSNTTIVTQLQTGEADAWFRADPGLYPQLAAMPGHTTMLTPYSIFGHVDTYVKDPILQDVHVRRAISLAIDRRKIIHNATHDAYIPSISDQPKFSWAYNPNLGSPDQDQPGARKLLDAAGWKPGPDGIRTKNGQRLELQLSYVGGQVVAPAIGALMEQDLKAVGIELTQKQYTSATFFAAAANGGILNTHKFQLAYFGWINGVDPDDSSLYMCKYIPPAGQNNLWWCDKKVDALEMDALTNFDVERRKQDYFAIQRELVDQAPTIILFAEQRIDTFNNHLKGYIPSPAQSADWNAWQWSMQ